MSLSSLLPEESPLHTLNLPRVAEHRNIAETVYESLKSAILENTLKAGSRLIEASIATELGVSNTPVREALTRLEREGLVTILPRRGAVVRSFSADDILEIGEVRELIEAHAIRKSVERRTSKVLAQLEAILDQCVPLVAARDLRSLNRLDVEFHRLLVRTSGNSRLIHVFEMLHDQFQVVRWRLAYLRARPQTTYEHHRQILAAFAAGDAAEAERRLRWHIRDTTEDLVRVMSENGAAHDQAPPWV